jgi:hypothetical protein
MENSDQIIELLRRIEINQESLLRHLQQAHVDAIAANARAEAAVAESIALQKQAVENQRFAIARNHRMRIALAVIALTLTIVAACMTYVSYHRIGAE